MAKPALLKPFSEEAFREWVEREEHRKDLEREARAIKAENDLVAEDLLKALVENDKTELVRGDFIGFIGEKKGGVGWKAEFIRLAGAAAANELATEAAKETTKFATISRRQG